MRIARVRIQNFRCFSDSSEWSVDWVPNTDLNLLIGANGSGKTALVDAIDFALNCDGRMNPAVLVTEYDFPQCDTSKIIEIEVTLTELGIVLADFEDDIQWIDKKTKELVDGDEEPPNEADHERAVIIRFEAKRDDEDGEIRPKWILPKLQKTEYHEQDELSWAQHEAIGYFRIQPAVSAGAFTLSQYSKLGRHLRKLKYRLGKLPEKLRPTQKLPECIISEANCNECDKINACKPSVEEAADANGTKPLGKMLGDIATRAQGMLSGSSWSAMNASLGPRYGGLRSSLAAITLGLRSVGGDDVGFIPFERLSAGEKYALSFALADTQIPGEVTPIIVMEEPETALFPAAIGQIVARLQGSNAPQLILTSHSESVVRRFELESIFRMDAKQGLKRVDTIVSDDAMRRALEYLIMPGSTSVLFVEKVLVVEGGGDAFASGVLDRLAGAVSRKEKLQKSFASTGWTVLSANQADNIPDTVEALKNLGIKVAALFDADAKGRVNADKIKDKCPVFTYERSNNGEVDLELALLLGLEKANQDKAIKGFQRYSECKTCSQGKNVRNCLNKNGCCLSVPKDTLKSEFRDSCLGQYRETKRFPRAFASLAEKLDTAQTGKIIELEVDNWK